MAMMRLRQEKMDSQRVSTKHSGFSSLAPPCEVKMSSRSETRLALHEAIELSVSQQQDPPHNIRLARMHPAPARPSTQHTACSTSKTIHTT